MRKYSSPCYRVCRGANLKTIVTSCFSTRPLLSISPRMEDLHFRGLRSGEARGPSKESDPIACYQLCGPERECA